MSFLQSHFSCFIPFKRWFGHTSFINRDASDMKILVDFVKIQPVWSAWIATYRAFHINILKELNRFQKVMLRSN